MRSATAMVLVLLMCSCGGESASEVTTAGDKTFQGDGYSFTYPGSWVQRGDLEAAAGDGGLYVGVNELGVQITDDNLDQYSADIVAGLDELFQQAQGRVTSEPVRDTVAGLPALRLEASAVNVDGIETKSHLVLIYDGTAEYLLNCQYTPEGAETMEAGCGQVVESFQIEQ
jgi:hypothetical protein